MSSPLISCLCITRNRPEYLRRAIACFHAQSYENRELLILFEDDDLATMSFLERMKNYLDHVRIIQVQKHDRNNLGMLRNLALQHAHGHFFCQWDDDDWSHPNRLSFQYEQLEGSNFAACVLGKIIIHDNVRHTLYRSCYRNWEGSVLCKKAAAIDFPYPELVRGEDTPLIDYLAAHEMLINCTTQPFYFVYTYHGNNTWHGEHFDSLFRFSRKLREADAIALLSELTL